MCQFVADPTIIKMRPTLAHKVVVKSNPRQGPYYTSSFEPGSEWARPELPTVEDYFSGRPRSCFRYEPKWATSRGYHVFARRSDANHYLNTLTNYLGEPAVIDVIVKGRAIAFESVCGRGWAVETWRPYRDEDALSLQQIQNRLRRELILKQHKQRMGYCYRALDDGTERRSVKNSILSVLSDKKIEDEDELGLMRVTDIAKAVARTRRPGTPAATIRRVIREMVKSGHVYQGRKTGQYGLPEGHWRKR